MGSPNRPTRSLGARDRFIDAGHQPEALREPIVQGTALSRARPRRCQAGSQRSRVGSPGTKLGPQRSRLGSPGTKLGSPRAAWRRALFELILRATSPNVLSGETRVASGGAKRGGALGRVCSQNPLFLSERAFGGDGSTLPARGLALGFGCSRQASGARAKLARGIQGS